MFNLMIWVATGATAGAILAAIRLPEAKNYASNSKGAVHILVCAATGAFIGLAIYVTLAYTLYHDRLISF